MNLFALPELRDFLADDPFSAVTDLTGESVREVGTRHTFKTTIDGSSYFVKWHDGESWKEVFKSLARLQLPIIGARNEYEMIGLLKTAGIASMDVAAFGERGVRPVAQQSFLITRTLEGTVTLEQLLRSDGWGKLSYSSKKNLVISVARIAKKMHRAGINHRDFYVCHFRIDEAALKNELIDPLLYLMDLHRAQCREAVPARWQIKDLAALLFSALQFGVERRWIFCFIREYFQMPLSSVLEERKSLLVQVESRTAKFFAREAKKNI